MNRMIIKQLLTLGFACGLGFSASAKEAEMAEEAVPFAVTISEFEGCECQSVCPCIFSQDTTSGECRGMLVFTFNGTYGDTKLDDVSCVVVLLSLGNNIEENIGNWKGALYTEESGTPAEFEAVTGILHAMVGNAFASMETRKADIQIKKAGDLHELVLGNVGKLKIHGIKGKNGAITSVSNAPSPVAFPVMYCSIADENTFNDGQAKWAFTGRNGFFAEFEFKSP